MKKTAYLILLIFLFGWCAVGAQDTPQQLLNAANNHYKAQNYEQAIEHYENLLQQGYRSEALYYNLGNAYYRQERLGKAILNYERALLLSPNDDEILHNLQLARQQQADDISVIPELFLSRWWRSWMLALGTNTWGIVALLLLWLGIGGLAIWLIGKNRQQKKRGFLIGVVLLLFSILPFSLAFSGKAYKQHSGVAILTQESMPLYSAPDTLSKELRLLHEGVRLSLIDSLSGWYKVQLTNGEAGWMPKSCAEEL